MSLQNKYIILPANIRTRSQYRVHLSQAPHDSIEPAVQEQEGEDQSSSLLETSANRSPSPMRLRSGRSLGASRNSLTQRTPPFSVEYSFTATSTPVTPSNRNSVVELDNLKCIICMDVYDEPTATNCGHVFCGRCICVYISLNNPRCPICQTQIAKATLLRIYP